MRHLIIMLIATALMGCGDNYAFGPGNEGGGGSADGGGGFDEGGSPPEGGAGGTGGMVTTDGGGGTGGSPQPCIAGDTVCAGTSVLTCDGTAYTDPVDCLDLGMESCVAGACEFDLELRLGFDEGSGNFTADDAQGLQGQLFSAGWTAGREGSAVLFNATGSVELGDVMNGMSLPFTISAWVKIPTGPNGNMTVVATDAEPPYQGAYLLVDMSMGATAVVGYGNAAGTGPAQRHAKRSTQAVPRDEWVHVAGVFRAPDDASVYINGADAGGSYSGSAQFVGSTSAPFAVGRDLDGAAGVVGSVDEVRIYSRALTHSDVMGLAGVSP